MKHVSPREIMDCLGCAAPEALERLVQMAERSGASDIHLQMRGQTAEVGFRLDGVLAPVTTLVWNRRRTIFSPVTVG